MLDARHDKMERIVKLSRDITIESKRIIFTLHRLALPKILYKVRYSGCASIYVNVVVVAFDNKTSHDVTDK